MAMMKKKLNKKTRGQKAEAKRMTAMGLSEARARLKEIDKQKAANPGIGFKIPKKEEAQLRKFVKEYGKAKPMKKAAPTAMKKAGKPKAKPKAAGRSNSVPTPLSPLFNPKGK